MTCAPFSAVPVRARRGGWTPDRQIAFISTLATLRCVAAACREVGLSWQSAYKLRARSDAVGFATAWDAALAGTEVAGPVTSRAIDGVAIPIMYRGRRVGERRRYDNRLAKFLVTLRDNDRKASSPTDRPPVHDTADALAMALAALQADLAAGTAPQAGKRFSR